ncbi:ATP synthase F0 subcomplex A subunit [Anaerobranca californiensis DSM 14826]|jgi:F-type H+-transporting ATPase subunit a|uniref:ATP synthase subunit a n=1 Tax=Anaerobranca californiensis DSM 14826 TaxID=1120989 RepID=A0A1M6MAU3_9FIRM|nr:F0F1 ATP synthase subunit A [Anaerobranca californiensis]SHJ80566.1 ATP synthase F0 subcomplex A subunit [Anaerobranca californiensis DSM 14826]
MDRILNGPRVFDFFGIPISESVIVMWIVMAIIILLAWVLRNSIKSEVPSGMQNFAEFIVESINSLVTSTMGEEKRGFAPYMGTLFIFIGLANIIGIFGLRPPTADINVTGTLAVMTFVLIHYYGLKSKGLGYFKSFAEPVFLFLPLNIIGELAKPVSLSFRLFGNIFAGTAILAMIYDVAPLFVPIIPHLYFDLFAGLLQSFIFLMLTMVFITLAMD